MPLLSGFWSKDEIIGVTLEASHGGLFGFIYYVLFLVAMATAALTAFYTFRAYFLTFWGETKIPPEAFAAHGHGGDHGGHEPHGRHSEAADGRGTRRSTEVGGGRF